MRKKLIYIISLLSVLALLLVLPTAAASETSGTCGTGTEWSFNSETGELVVSGSGAIADYSSADVTPWSAYKTKIKSITIKEGITFIGANAFSGTSAETVWMADTVTQIEHHGFSGCKKLKSVKFSQNLAGAKNYVFSGCDLLDNVVLPSTFSSSSTGMFLNCTSLKSLTLEEGVKKVGNNFFAGCESLVEVTLPSTLESLGNSYATFKGCSALTKLVFLSASTKIPGTDPQYIPTSVEIHGYVGSTAETYANTHGHKFVKLPEPALYSGTCGEDLTWTLTASGLLTISGSGAMTNYTVETGATPAPWYAYRESIVEIVIEDGVTEIGNYAFNGCVSVVKATMTDSITKIKGYAFRGCHRLESVYLSKNTESIGTFAFVNNKLLDNLVIPSKVSTIGTGAFQNCYALKNLTIEEGVGALGNDVFYNCTALKEVTLPKSLAKVGSERGAFRGCSALEKIVFLSTTTTIPDNADAIPSTATIYGYTDSTADSYATKYKRNKVITAIPTTVDGFCGSEGDGSSVKWIFDTATGELVIEGSGAIADYTANTPSPWNEYKDEIISIDIKDGITTIGKYAFNAHAVESVALADSVKSIRGYAFRSCSSLTSLKLGKNIETIGEFAFTGASALTSLTLPGTITSIGSHTFQNCSSLSELIIEEGLTSIYNGAFAKCKSLKRVVIPSSVIRVGDTKGAFYECENLEEIIFLSPYTLIPDNQDAIPSTAKIYGFGTSTAKNYADKYSVDISVFADFCDGGITIFELDGAEVKASKGEYLSVASIACLNEKTFPSVSLLLANDNGELSIKTADNAYVPLCARTGEALILSDGSKLTVIYDDATGRARYYFNQNVAVASDEDQTFEFQIADQQFIDIDAYAVSVELADKATLSSSYSFSSKAPKFLGFQTHDTDDTKIRIIAGVDMLYYTNVGFEVSLYSDEILQKTTMLDSTSVFSSVVANSKALTAESLGVKYLSAIAINDIDCKKLPKDSSIHLTIKPYATVGQEKIYGEERKIMIFYDTDTNRHSYASDNEKIDLDGKKVLFIGNSQLYFGLTVFKKDAKSVTSQAAREGDRGYFYQLCKENGFDVSVTNWTYGGHGLYDLVDKPCTIESCEGRIHINDMVDPTFDYVFISCSSGKASEESFFDDIEFYVNYFKAANPAVKIVCLGNLLVRGYSTSGDDLPGIYNNYKTLEKQGIIIADWGSMVYDVIHGNASIPNATQEFNMNTFIVKDKKHPNPLVGYITALTAYSAITGESPIGQPYKFCFDPTVNEQFDMNAYESSNYTASWTSNFRSVFESESDMAGIQQLIKDYLEAKPYRNY